MLCAGNPVRESVGRNGHEFPKKGLFFIPQISPNSSFFVYTPVFLYILQFFCIYLDVKVYILQFFCIYHGISCWLFQEFSHIV